MYQADYVVTIGARSDEDAIARHLYKYCVNLMIGMWMRFIQRVFNTEDRSGDHEPVNESSRTSGDSCLMGEGRITHETI